MTKRKRKTCQLLRRVSERCVDSLPLRDRERSNNPVGGLTEAKRRREREEKDTNRFWNQTYETRKDFEALNQSRVCEGIEGRKEI